MGLIVPFILFRSGHLNSFGQQIHLRPMPSIWIFQANHKAFHLFTICLSTFVVMARGFLYRMNFQKGHVAAG